MTLPRCIELQWQQEIIELWLSSSRIPDDSRPGLLEMLSVVKQEAENLGFQDNTHRSNSSQPAVQSARVVGL
jgi:hypothetical protein